MDQTVLSLFCELITKEQKLQHLSVKNVLELFEQGATLPFIARYRKEMTNSMDEVQLDLIKRRLDQLKELLKRKAFVISKIEEQEKLTDSLRAKIDSSWDEKTIEDLYLPFKKKQKTKAAVARALGLEPLAKIIMRQETRRLEIDAKHFVNGKVPTVDFALEQARYIVAEWISENIKAREIARSVFKKSVVLTAKLIKKKEAEAEKFKDYFNYSQPLEKIPSHRLLAILRAEEEGYLRVKLEPDEERLLYRLEKLLIFSHHECADQITLALQDSYKRLLYPAIQNESRKQAKAKADEEAISVFAENLKQLLLAAPLGSKNTLALDPGFRTGCKLVVLGKQGDLLENSTIYPHPPQMKVQESIDRITKLTKKYDVQAIAIGNGTAGKETMALVKAIPFERQVECFLVNESGASIYSASEIARTEFPDHDITVRGAVSIGRRLMDPLAELVKIDPRSIGVGQYQHDVNQSKLKDRLDFVVAHCVNNVGVNLNTASKHLLTYVAGIGPGLAQKMVEHRTQNGPYQSRKEILDVAGLGKKAFEQAAGFLRIKDGKNPLDNTAVHPERYALVKLMAKDNGTNVGSFVSNQEILESIKPQDYLSDKLGLPTLNDIVLALKKPGLDPRGEAQQIEFNHGINSMDDIKVGDIVSGVINNLTKFGAFVDIGIKESGLIHISQIANRFISDPAELLKLNQQVRARVIDMDKARKRISLSLKEV